MKTACADACGLNSGIHTSVNLEGLYGLGTALSVVTMRSRFENEVWGRLYMERVIDVRAWNL
jgi:hypothetical protein